MNRKILVLALLVVAVAAVVAVRYWPNDERAIRKRIAHIETLGSKEASEKPVDSLVRARALATLFSDPCILKVESTDFNGAYSRKEIQDRIALVRGAYTSATVSVHDLAIEITDKKSATLRCTLRIKGASNASTNSPVADVQELEAGLQKSEGDWFFSTVTVVEVLER